ncbi:VWA domain-containing protein [bacterium]|nr:VWA domain-containing protein [bacterium]
MARRFLFLAIALSCMSGATYAQPYLNFKRAAVNWPTIELYFSVACDGTPAYNMAKEDFSVFENGVEVKDFTMSCPDPSQHCPASVALVFDASGSMSGAGNAGAMAAGHAFVDRMDESVDEAVVLWFNERVNIAQQTTRLQFLLHAAIDSLPVGGATAVWDGAYEGIFELINNGINPCRAVILLCDGADNSSTRTPAEIINLAINNHIRVYTVAYGSNVNAVELEMIAILTGGRYYRTPDAGQLASIYDEIATILFQGFQECVITYERDCADGEMRSVELHLTDFCGGTDVKTRSYRAPSDSSTYSDLYMEVGTRTGEGRSDITIPLELLTPAGDKLFYPFEYTLLYDKSKLVFLGAEAPPGTLLENVGINATEVAGGMRVQTTDRKLLSGTGTLMELTFRASDPDDTTCVQIDGSDGVLEQGCFLPKFTSGEICIYPQLPILTCDVDAPLELTWQRAINDYLPNPFEVVGRFGNQGDWSVENVRFKIAYNANDIELVSPLSDEQPGVPADIDTGAYTEVRWQVSAKRRSNGVATQICITAMADNHRDVTCCTPVYIPPTDPILECGINVPTLVADTVRGVYAPMPFPVTLTVTNTGGLRTDSVFATIILPPDLSLADIDAPDNNTKRILPSRLSSAQSGSVMWMVKHPRTLTAQQYDIQIWVKTANADSTMCQVTITIPPLTAPLSVKINPLGALTFCEGESLILDGGAGYETYLWSKGDTTRRIEVTQSGAFWVEVTDYFGQTAMSDTINVTAVPLPPKPMITRSGDSLRTDPATSWQWMKDTTSIPGATGRSYKLDDVGVYRVIVRNGDGCENVSDPFTVDVLDAEFPVPGLFAVDIYPQPGSGALNLRFHSSRSESVDITAYDLLGRAVYSSEAFRIVGLHTFTIETDGWGRGIYYLHIHHGGVNTIRAVQIR